MTNVMDTSGTEVNNSMANSPGASTGAVAQATVLVEEISDTERAESSRLTCPADALPRAQGDCFTAAAATDLFDQVWGHVEAVEPIEGLVLADQLVVDECCLRPGQCEQSEIDIAVFEP